MQSRKPFLARVLVGSLAAGVMLGTGVFVGVRLASATPGGRTRDELTYAGVLSPAPAGGGRVRLTFEFTHATRGDLCNVAIADDIAIAPSGAFSVQVPLTGCPHDLFDGGDVTYNVRQTAPTTEMLATGVRINPVPYARFADQAGVNNDCPAGYLLDATERPLTVCRRALTGGRFDEVVKVGRGASAFWIDRYEASVWSSFEGVAPQLFATGESDFNAAQFPRNG